MIDWRELPLDSDALLFQQRAGHLHSMIASCGHERREAGDDYDWHGLKRGSTEFFLFQYTLAGEGRLVYDGETHVIKPGELMLLGIPHDHRYWMPEDGDYWQFIYVCLYGRETLRLLRDLVRQTGPLLSLGTESATIQLALDVIARAQQGGIRNPYDNSRCCYDLIMQLCSEKMPNPDAGEDKPDFIRTVTRHCRENLSAPLAIDELADLAGYSRYHFTRVFAKYQGMSPGNYVISLRMKEAVRLLQTENLTVKEVADLCGYPDCSYFCRLFRKTYGMTPEAYRRSGMR